MPQQGQYGYPGVSPGGASPAFFSPQPFPPAYYTQPQSPYLYEAPRAPSSPHSLTYAPSGAVVQQSHARPVKSTTANRRRPSKTEDMASQMKQDERNSTDSSMLQAFTRGPK